MDFNFFSNIFLFEFANLIHLDRYSCSLRSKYETSFGHVTTGVLCFKLILADHLSREKKRVIVSELIN